VLTVSDSVHGGTRKDDSGAAVVATLQNNGFAVLDRRVCPDGLDEVVAALIQLCSGFSGLIVTTGGTGFSPRDWTPEATRRVIEREAPGLSEAMRATNALGRLSRGVAGTSGACLIINVPGSPAGAIESIESIVDALPHALELLSGGRPH
jgi:molybdopterin adenylyltransferase